MQQPAEHNHQRILTTAQIAAAYRTDTKHINDNFQNNKGHYTLGKHYYRLEGDELKQFINLYPEIFGEQNVSKMRVLYLWTEKGALLHAKSLNTDKAWEAYERLIDEYYRVKDLLPALNGLWERRLKLFGQYNKIPLGYWCIFGFVAGHCFLEEFRNVHLLENALPDGSIGKMWCQHLRANGFDMSLIKKYRHRYPDKRGEQWANVYPNDWLGEFWTWFHEFYLKQHWPKYLAEHRMSLPAPQEQKQLAPTISSRKVVTNG